MSRRHLAAIANAASSSNEQIVKSNAQTVSEKRRKEHEESEKSYKEWLDKVDAEIKERETKRKQEKIHYNRVMSRIHDAIKTRRSNGGGKRKKMSKTKKNRKSRK